MKAVIMYKPGDVRIEDIEIPKPGRQEVLLKVNKSGVCGTDNMLYRGAYYANYPVVFGHEYSGEVVELGEDVKNFKVGDRVAVNPNIVCHKCYFCRSGMEHLCENLLTLGIHINGGFAEFSVVPETNIFNLPSNLPYEAGALAEPLSCTLRGIEMANIQHGDTVILLGAGGMGNLIMQLVSIAGAVNIVVSDPIKKRREIAMEYGATHVIDPTNEDVEKELKKIKYCGADVVFEVTGRTEVAQSALSLSRRGGRIVWFGTCAKGKTIPISPFDVNENEITVCGSFNNPYTQIKAIDLLASGKVKFSKLVNPTISLNDFNKVWEIFGGSDTMRIMVDTE